MNALPEGSGGSCELLGFANDVGVGRGGFCVDGRVIFGDGRPCFKGETGVFEFLSSRRVKVDGDVGGDFREGGTERLGFDGGKVAEFQCGFVFVDSWIDGGVIEGVGVESPVLGELIGDAGE